MMPAELRRIDKALPSAEQEGLARERAAWRAGHLWSPNQLRHTAATEVRKRYGLEAAQIVLGHAAADVTQVYAERDLVRGADIMRQIG
jgi:integrase